MPWDLNYIPREGTVVLRHNGPLSLDEGRKQSEAVVALLKTTRARRVFVDHSLLAGSLSAADIAALTGYYPQLKAPTGLRIAIVLAQDEEGRHFDVYHKLLCSPRGYAISLFHSSDLARRWLTETPP